METGVTIILSFALGLLGILILWAVYKKKINRMLKDTGETTSYFLEFGLVFVVFILVAYLLIKFYKWILPKSWLYPALQITFSLMALTTLFFAVWIWFI